MLSPESTFQSFLQWRILIHDPLMHFYANRLLDHIAEQDVDPPVCTAHIEEKGLLRSQE